MYDFCDVQKEALKACVCKLENALCDFFVFPKKKLFLKLSLTNSLTYILSFSLPRLLGIEAMRKLVLRLRNQVKEKKQSRFVVLCGKIAVSSYPASKEPVGKCNTP